MRRRRSLRSVGAVVMGGGAAAPLLPFTDDFTRSNGAIGNGWTGGTWTVASNAAVNAPTLGAELLTNGDFAAWTGDNPDGWTVGTEDANNYVTESTGRARLVSNGTAMYVQQYALTIGAWYQGQFEVIAIAAGYIKAVDGLASAIWVPPTNTTGVKVGVARAVNTQKWGIWRQGVMDVTFDDASLKALTLASLFASRDAGIAAVTASVALTRTLANSQGGLILNLDSASTPQNFVLAYVDGSTGNLVKCVAGTYTSVISAAVTYGAGKVVKVIKSGNNYSLYYGTAGSEAQVGTTQAIADAGIANNTLHGLFSTHSGNTFDNYSLAAT